jgi:inner membrane protein
MLLRTHLVISLFFALFLSQYFQHRLSFIFLVLLATALADIDNANSVISKNLSIISKFIRFFIKHRGFFHSLTFAIVLAVFVSSISKFVSIAIFLGYTLHLLTDSFTKQGIQAFWPLPFLLRGNIKTSGFIEKLIFWLFVIANVVFLVHLSSIL